MKLAIVPLIIFAMALITLIAVAQETSGTLAGQVLGLSGEELSKAPIEAKNVDSGQVFKTSSSVNGSYLIADLPAGKYEISSPVAGFERKQATYAPEKLHESIFTLLKSVSRLALWATMT
jgi:Carboxypeptidase regulatory-like domain